MADRKQRPTTVIRNSAVIKNPVLFESIGIAPVVAMAISLKSAIILSFVSAVELIVIECITCLLFKHLKGSIRKMLYAFLGLLINLPLFMLFKSIVPNETANAGIFLPLLAVNSLIALHCERYAVKHTIKATFLDALSAGVSYAVVILIVGILREIFGNGTFYGLTLNLPVKLSGLLMPFGGFLLLGFMAAALKSVINKKYPETHPESSFDLSEVEQSHVIKLRDFLNDDLDLYEDGETEIAGEFTKSKNFEKTDTLTDHKKETHKPKAQKPTAEKRRKNQKEQPDTRSAEHRVPAQKDDDYTSEFSEILSELEQYKENYTESDEAKNTTVPDESKGGDDK